MSTFRYPFSHDDKETGLERISEIRIITDCDDADFIKGTCLPVICRRLLRRA